MDVLSCVLMSKTSHSQKKDSAGPDHGGGIAPQISLPELLWLCAIFLLPLFFWPTLYTTFELPKVALLHGVTIAMVLMWLFRRGWPQRANMELTWAEESSSRLTDHLAREGRSEVSHEGVHVHIPPHANVWQRFISHLRAQKDVLKQIRVPLIFIGLIIVSWIVCTIFSVAPEVSFYGYYPRFQGLYTWLTYVVFAVIVFFNISGDPQNSRRRIERIFGAIALSSLVNGAIALLQKCGFSALNFWDTAAFLGRPFGMMGHPDFLAAVLVISIPLTVYLILANRYTAMAFASFIVSIAALFFTLSRAAFIGVFAGLFLFLLIYSVKTGAKKMFWCIVAAPLLVIALVAIVNINPGNDFVRGNFLLNRVAVSGESLRSIETRMALWPATARQIFARPFVGYGFDAFAISFPPFYPAELNTLENLGDYPDRAHNFVLDYAVQSGIPALLIFLGFIVFVFWRALRFIFKNGDSPNGWLLPLALAASFTGILTANFFGFFTTVTWAYFWLIVALIIFVTIDRKGIFLIGGSRAKQNYDWQAANSAEKTADSIEETAELRTADKGVNYRMVNHRDARGIQKIILILALAAGIFIFYGNDYLLIRADLAYRDAYDGNAAAYFDAAEIAPQISFYGYEAAESALKMAMGAVAQNEKPQVLSDLNLALKFNEAAGKITNYDGKYFLNEGDILHAIHRTIAGKISYAATDDVPAFDAPALAMFEKAIALMPASPRAYLDYGTALYEDGDYVRATALLEKYLSLCPDYYKWKYDLASRSREQQEQYRIFYKLNPDFNKVFGILSDAYAEAGNTQKAAEYGRHAGN
jgi:O-antigen ligase/tetratricopeptide (TPR) repeat protein